MAEDVVDLVRLRRWALATLSRLAVSHEQVQDIPSRTWARFLEYEGCAGALLAVLGQPLPPAVDVQVATEAMREAERALRAEREARWLGRVAGDLGIRAILLKGGVATVRGDLPPLQMADLDILARPSDVPLVDAALKDAGYRPRDPGPHATEFHHPAGRFAVELHWSLTPDGAPVPERLWSGSRPLAALPGLHELGPADQLVHLTRHAVLRHSDRGIRLRDLILIGDADRRCGEAERARADEQLARSPHASSVLAAVETARRLRDAGGVSRDPWERSTIGYYVAQELGNAGFRLRDAGSHGSWRFVALASGRLSVRELLRMGVAQAPVAPPRLRWLDELWPPLGPALLRASRTAYYLGGAATGAPLIVRLQQQVRRRLLAA